MTKVASNVDYLTSAAASAAKARFVEPVSPTRDSLDVATALKCMTSFQTPTSAEGLRWLDDESYAAPLVASARILQATAQHRRRVGADVDAQEVDELLLNSSVAFAMLGNFPSARAVLTEVSDSYLASSVALSMVAFICDPHRPLHAQIRGNLLFWHFWNLWSRVLHSDDAQARDGAFDRAIEFMMRECLAGSVSEGALAMSARMAAHQARRLSTIRLLEDAPGVPDWFVRNAVSRGILTLLPPQRQLLVDEGLAGHRRNALLTLPTSTGKTFIAQACIAAGLEKEGVCVYVAPYVAIGEQVRTSMEGLVGTRMPVVSMFGGFKLETLIPFANRQVVIATPERFDAWLRAGVGVEQLKTVVLDEVHIVENGARGARVEGLVSRLRLLQDTLPELRLVALSAVLSEPEAVSEWLSVDPKDLHRIAWRPTARRLAICRADGDLYWMHGNDSLRPAAERPNKPISVAAKLSLPGEILRTRFPQHNELSSSQNVNSIAKDLLIRLGAPGLVVCPRKAHTWMLARTLAAEFEPVDVAEVHEVAERIAARHSWLSSLSEYIKRGVAFHNASLPHDVRRDIEGLTRDRLLRVVCSTTTLAEGADLPFRWTIVSHWLVGFDDGGTKMDSMTFRNIAGRCGRAGAFTEGDTVLFENLLGPPAMSRGGNNLRSLEQVIFSSAPLQSTLANGWSEMSDALREQIAAMFGSQLLACIAEHPKAEDVASLLAQSSFAQRCGAGDFLKRILESTLAEALNAERTGGAFAVANSPVSLTPLGRAANQSGFSPMSCRRMMDFLARSSFPDGAQLYVELLLVFFQIPEQSDRTLRKILTTARHRTLVKATDLNAVMSNLLARTGIRETFELLPARQRSTAQPDNIEKQFEIFVSFVDTVIVNFLPWLLRGLHGLKDFGSDEAASVDWAGRARLLEERLRDRAGGELTEEVSEDGE